MILFYELQFENYRKAVAAFDLLFMDYKPQNSILNILERSKLRNDCKTVDFDDKNDLKV